MIYIAGPFFTDKERAFLKIVIDTVKNYFPNEELFIPMEHFIPDGENLSNNEWAEAVFKMDVEASQKFEADNTLKDDIKFITKKMEEVANV